MVRTSISHLYRCADCLGVITDEGELVKEYEKYIEVICVHNVTVGEPITSTEAAVSNGLRPISCNNCNARLGYRCNKTPSPVPLMYKIVLFKDKIRMGFKAAPVQQDGECVPQ